MPGPNCKIAVLLILGVLLLRHADSNCSEEGQHWCYKEFNFTGECFARTNCLCLCYDIHDNKMQASVAYFGELGYELQLVTPYVYHLQARGMLHRTVGSLGSSTWMYFSPQHQEVKLPPRHFCGGTASRPTPHRFWDFDYHDWSPPPYKEHFAASGIRFKKPSFVIHNKYALEWGGPPINFLDIPTLMRLADMLTPHYTVVYVRPGWTHQVVAPGYAVDGSEGDDMPDLGEHALLKQSHPDLVLFQDLVAERPGATWNEILVNVHAACNNYISVFGGNAVIASYFAGHNIVFSHTDSIEANHWEFDVFHSNLTENKGTVEAVRTFEDLFQRVEQAFLAG